MNTITTTTNLTAPAIRKQLCGIIEGLPQNLKLETLADIYRGVVVEAANSALRAKSQAGKTAAVAVAGILCELPTIEAVRAAVDAMYTMFERFASGDHIAPDMDSIHPELYDKFIAEMKSGSRD